MLHCDTLNCGYRLLLLRSVTKNRLAVKNERDLDNFHKKVYNKKKIFLLIA